MSKADELVEAVVTEDPTLVISSSEACNVIIFLQEKMMRQRAFWDMRLHCLKKKLEDKIQFLENKLSSN